MSLGDKFELVDADKIVPPDRVMVIVITNYMRVCEAKYDHFDKKWGSQDFRHLNEKASYWMKKISE